MHAEPFHPDAPPDVATDAAVIHPVTPAALDEVAHRAAQLADDVGHGAAVRQQDTPPGDAPSRQETTDAAVMPTVQAAEDARNEGAGGEGARDPADATRDGLAEARQAALETVETVAAAVEPSAAVSAEAADAGAEAAKRLSGDAIGRYNAAVFGMIRTNVAATGELFTALVKAQSVPEAVAINAEHLRRQFDMLTAQGHELAELARALAFDGLQPLAGRTRRDS